MSTRIRRFFEAVQRDPPRTVWIKLLSELGYRRLLLLARPLADIGAAPPGHAALSFELLGADTVREYAALRADEPIGAIEARLRAGNLCFLARREGRIVGACWSATHDAWAEFLGCSVPLAEGDVYFFDAYTAPECRGQAIAPAVCHEQLAYFAARGHRRALRLTLPENAAALRAHAKSGFVPIGLVGRVKLGHWQRVFRRSSAPAAHVVVN